MKIDGVYVPGEGYCETAPNTAVTKVLVFAGKGTGVDFRAAPLLSAKYGGQPENWQKVRGEVILITGEWYKRAEVHWACERTVGRVELKFKRWIDRERLK
ncbi:MAG: hypothetical protein LBB74_04000 [Chitinispirillales bacterium]|nr:hypothetical protein [Chitinispirillales bacterium]